MSKSTRSSRYMRSFKSFEIVFCEEHQTRKAAMQREWELKSWPKKKKEILIKDYSSKAKGGI